VRILFPLCITLNLLPIHDHGTADLWFFSSRHLLSAVQPAVRLCAVQWAVRLFPPSHLPSRHICILAAGDTKPEVRELGLNGLGLGRGSSPYAGPPAAAAGGGDSKQGGAGAAELPNVAAVVGYFRGQYPALAGPADVNRWDGVKAWQGGNHFRQYSCMV
jgi:hypothetical protein